MACHLQVPLLLDMWQELTHLQGEGEVNASQWALEGFELRISKAYLYRTQGELAKVRLMALSKPGQGCELEVNQIQVPVSFRWHLSSKLRILHTLLLAAGH